MQGVRVVETFGTREPDDRKLARCCPGKVSAFDAQILDAEQSGRPGRGTLIESQHGWCDFFGRDGTGHGRIGKLVLQPNHCWLASGSAAGGKNDATRE